MSEIAKYKKKRSIYHQSHSRKYVYLWIFILSLLYACNEQQTNQHEPDKDTNLPKAQLVVSDSITIRYDTAFIFNYHFDLFSQDYIMGLDAQHKVVLFNKEGAYIKKIGKQGQGPEEYARCTGIYAHSLDSIFVVDRLTSRVLLYNGKNKLCSSWNLYKADTKNEFPSFYNFFSVTSSSTKAKNLSFEYLGRSTKAYNMTDKRYYENAQLLSTYSTLDSSCQYSIPYEEESIYLGNQYFLSPLDPAMTKTKKGEFIVVFAHEDKIYWYDAEKKLKKIISGDSKYFPKTAQGVSFEQKDSNFGRDYVKYNVKQNALNHYRIASFEEDNQTWIFKQYDAPLKADIPNDMNYLRTNYHKRDTYLQLFNELGERAFEDILQAEKLGTLVYAQNKDYLIFQPNNSLTEKNILYVAKITLIE